MASLAEVLMASLLVVAFGLLAASCVETAHQPLLLRFDTVSIYSPSAFPQRPFHCTDGAVGTHVGPACW